MPAFDSANAKLAGFLSGAARRAKNKTTVADQALEDMIALKAILMSLMSIQRCEKCGREGPKVSEYIDLVKTLLQLNSAILDRLKGKPPTESTAQRYGSVSEYTKAANELRTDESTYIPDDLPSPPD